MQSMWCHWSKPQEEILLCKRRTKKSSFQEREKSDGKGRGVSNYPIVEVYNDGSKTHASHMKVPPGNAVLDCGAAKSLCGAKPIALRQSMRAIISEESEIRWSAHS